MNLINQTSFTQWPEGYFQFNFMIKMTKALKSCGQNTLKNTQLDSEQLFVSDTKCCICRK